jgi:hypothetical protein
MVIFSVCGKISKGESTSRSSWDPYIENCVDMGLLQGFHWWSATILHFGKLGTYDDCDSKIKKRERTKEDPKFCFLVKAIHL